ncbi:tRNA pseudouridine(38-40) synthase TruA [Sediminitomix flava]|uniref:tRNA pseudouridine synthase A n=1 Tax=Sediminitomix flava TaxID=379075 RepID=A0A315Z851_SEDFL|nr:tRNA pseudouridine(38-40) synthase TruA [Sediminitomix flava]PWJ41037.1 tRNA pseudouridine38-40 synthase [Sediminitomix flava]
MRYFIEVAYHGANYNGWQIQPEGETVQGKLNYVLSKLIRAEIAIMGSGRTDTGVHCRQQFAHFDLDKPLPFSKKDLLHKANVFLPDDIVIKSIHEVKPDVHARFTATDRVYHYHITSFKDPFGTGQEYLCPKPLDLPKMNEACKVLLELTDYEAFSKSKMSVKTFECDITEAYFKESEPGKYIFRIKANRFLRGMVRIIVGNLLQIGLGNLTAEEMRSIIIQKKRVHGRFLVPAQGLYLQEVHYPEGIWLEEPSDEKNY